MCRLFKFLRQTEPYPRGAFDQTMAAERAKYLERNMVPAAERALADQQARSVDLQRRAQEVEEERQRQLAALSLKTVRTRAAGVGAGGLGLGVGAERCFRRRLMRDLCRAPTAAERELARAAGARQRAG